MRISVKKGYIIYSIFNSIMIFCKAKLLRRMYIYNIYF